MSRKGTIYIKDCTCIQLFVKIIISLKTCYRNWRTWLS